MWWPQISYTPLEEAERFSALIMMAIVAFLIVGPMVFKEYWDTMPVLLRAAGLALYSLMVVAFIVATVEVLVERRRRKTLRRQR